jgi:hypothetical protein
VEFASKAGRPRNPASKKLEKRCAERESSRVTVNIRGNMEGSTVAMGDTNEIENSK